MEGKVTYVLIPEEDWKELLEEVKELKEMLIDKRRMEDGSKWLDAKEAREFLGVSAKTFQTWRDKRLFPFTQFGKKLYFRVSDIDAFLESHMKTKEDLVANEV